MKHVRLTVLMSSLALGGFVDANPSQGPAYGVATEAVVPESGWIANAADCICGTSDVTKISNPAKVDYEALLDATSEMKEMKRDRIDPDSIRGKDLRKRASTAVTKICEVVRAGQGHCGVWKVIRNADGRIVPDITSQVREQL
jgi:hypothetical protein